MRSGYDWNPKRKGNIYCSPACGYNCTYAQFQEANTNADILAGKLPSVFKPKVWENGKWNYRVEALFHGETRIAIWEHTDGTYWIDAHIAYGDGFGESQQIHEDFDDLHNGLSQIIDKINFYCDRVAQSVSQIAEKLDELNKDTDRSR